MRYAFTLNPEPRTLNQKTSKLKRLTELEMTEALILMGGMGLIISAILAVASKVFYVYVDPQIISVEEELPGAN